MVQILLKHNDAKWTFNSATELRTYVEHLLAHANTANPQLPRGYRAFNAPPDEDFFEALFKSDQRLYSLYTANSTHHTLCVYGTQRRPILHLFVERDVMVSSGAVRFPQHQRLIYKIDHVHLIRMAKFASMDAAAAADDTDEKVAPVAKRQVVRDPHKENVTAALKELVEPQRRAFLNSFRDSGIGATHTVQYANGITLEQLRDDWLNEHGIDCDVLSVRHTQRVLWELTDEDIAENWIAYHQIYAEYALVPNPAAANLGVSAAPPAPAERNNNTVGRKRKALADNKLVAPVAAQ